MPPKRKRKVEVPPAAAADTSEPTVEARESLPQPRRFSDEEMAKLEELIYEQHQMLSTIIDGFDEIPPKEKPKVLDAAESNSKRLRSILCDQRLGTSHLPACQLVRQATTKKCVKCMVETRHFGKTATGNLPKGTSECSTCSSWLEVPFTLCGSCANSHYEIFLRPDLWHTLLRIINDRRVEAGKKPIFYFHIPKKPNVRGNYDEDDDSQEDEVPQEAEQQQVTL